MLDRLKHATLLLLTTLSVSCVSLVTPEQAAIEVSGVKPASVGVTVADQRTQVSGGFRKSRYYGRTRMSYGIPQPILDPKMSVADRLAAQLEAGFRKNGVAVHKVATEFRGDPASAIRSAGTSSRFLVVKLENVWIDFANPLFGKQSILYFHATAQVMDAGGKVQASTSKRFEKRFRYDVNDSFFNQAVWTLQPEFAALVNRPEIRRALAR